MTRGAKLSNIPPQVTRRIVGDFNTPCDKDVTHGDWCPRSMCAELEPSSFSNSLSRPRSDNRAKCWCQCARARLTVIVMSRAAAGLVEGRERGARAAGLEAGNRHLARRHARGKVAARSRWVNPAASRGVADLPPPPEPGETRRGRGTRRSVRTPSSEGPSVAAETFRLGHSAGASRLLDLSTLEGAESFPLRNARWFPKPFRRAPTPPELSGGGRRAWSCGEANVSGARAPLIL